MEDGEEGVVVATTSGKEIGKKAAWGRREQMAVGGSRGMGSQCLGGGGGGSMGQGKSKRRRWEEKRWRWEEEATTGRESRGGKG